MEHAENALGEVYEPEKKKAKGKGKDKAKDKEPETEAPEDATKSDFCRRGWAPMSPQSLAAACAGYKQLEPSGAICSKCSVLWSAHDDKACANRHSGAICSKCSVLWSAHDDKACANRPSGASNSSTNGNNAKCIKCGKEGVRRSTSYWYCTGCQGQMRCKACYQDGRVCKCNLSEATAEAKPRKVSLCGLCGQPKKGHVCPKK